MLAKASASKIDRILRLNFEFNLRHIFLFVLVLDYSKQYCKQALTVANSGEKWTGDYVK